MPKKKGSRVKEMAGQAPHDIMRLARYGDVAQSDAVRLVELVRRLRLLRSCDSESPYQEGEDAWGEIRRRIFAAIDSGDAGFLYELAKVCERVKHPIDPIRLRVATKKRLAKALGKPFKPTITELQKSMAYLDLDEGQKSPRQIRRAFTELGVEYAREKPGRRKGK